jgi:hypothetical protein
MSQRLPTAASLATQQVLNMGSAFHCLRRFCSPPPFQPNRRHLSVPLLWHVLAVAPGSDLHISLALQRKFCAERLLGAVAFNPQTSSSSPSDLQQTAADSAEAREDVSAWLSDGLHLADAEARQALQSRYGQVVQLLWCSITEELSTLLQ